MTSTSALPGTTILNLPAASQLDGTEWVPMVQGGTTVRSQSGDVSNILSNIALVLTTSAPAGYSNARQLAAQSGVTSITDGGGSSQVVVGIATNGIGNAQIRQSAGLSVIGRGSSITGNVADITGTSDQTLIVSSGGTTLGFGQLNLSSSNAVTGVLGAGFGGTGNSALSPYQVIAAGTASSGAFQSVTAGTSGYVLTYVSSTSLPVWQSIPGFTQATAGNIANYTSSNSVGGNSYANISSATVTIGVASSLTGNLALASSIGGTTIITPSSASPTITLPQATTTLIGRDTVDTLTGKTFNTASSSNHLLINSVAITAVTGTGSVTLNSTPTISSAAITGGQINALSSFGLRTTGAAFDLILGSTEALTASRNLNIRVGDASRNLVLTGDLTLTTSYALSYTLTNTSSLTLPTSGTLATLANTETLTNKTITTANNTIQVGATTLSTISDLLNTLGSSQGQILYKGSGTPWVALTVGSSTQVLLGGTIPQWGSLSGTGTVTAVTGGSGIVTSPSTITSSGTISLASISNNSVLGNVSGGSATPSSLSGAQIATLLTAPTRQFFASGAGTYTITSTAVKYIVVKMIGGGGGGGGSGTAPGAATAGSATTFGSSIFSAGGGNAGALGGGSGGTASSTASIFSVAGGSGGNGSGVTTANPGGMGGVSFFGGAGGGGAAGAGAGVAAVANSGSGGGGGGVNTTANGGGGGGAGAYLEGLLTSPSSTYAYSVGAGGSGGTAGGSGAAGGNGGSGQIVVYEYYQ